MSHKRAKARRKFVHSIMPDVKELPLSKTEKKHTGKFRKMTATQLNVFKKLNGYFPIAQVFLTKECRKYWYNKA